MASIFPRCMLVNAAIVCLGGGVCHQAAWSQTLPNSDLEEPFPLNQVTAVDLLHPEMGESLLMDQVTSVAQLTDVRPSDWAFQALQSLVERYGCIVGYPDRTYRGNRAITRYEFAAGLNACLDKIQELITAGTDNLVRKEDLLTFQRLQEEFAAELATLRGRLDGLEVRTATLEQQRFSPTTKLIGQAIVAVSDTYGNAVGKDSDRSQPFLADRVRLNFESSFTGRDLLRVRFQFGNFLAADGSSQIGDVTRTNMTRLNFDTDFGNLVTLAHLRYYFPVSESVAFVVGPAGIGYTDITDTVTPTTIADDGLGIPSLFGEYNPVFRRGGGGGAINWNINPNLVFTAGYLASSPNNPSVKNGLFNGGYNALAHLVYYADWGSIGIAYSHSYAPGGQVNLTGSTGSILAASPFGNSIATSSHTIGMQGFYRFSPNFQIHAWGGYIQAQAKNDGFSSLSNGRGRSITRFVDDGDRANIWYGAIGLSFPDVGGRGNLPGIVVGLPPRVTNSDIRDEADRSVHVEAFYRIQLNDNISITPGVWAVFNPENSSDNDTQIIGVLRTYFLF
ncbi:iron uptake porin [Pantanalinema rosaneae CENA516]|uniref:iron uptake porin n=1 Tax=Pantanalinema rosaneae TaxID=1620701 RepID=UPI003D6E7468